MERYNVRVTDEAKLDIRSAIRYIAVDLREPDTAERFLDDFDSEIDSLETMPERYSLVPDEYLASLGIRMTSVRGYLIFYTVSHANASVDIIRVLHGKRNWVSILTEQHKS